jgi:hypothetical protein
MLFFVFVFFFFKHFLNKDSDESMTNDKTGQPLLLRTFLPLLDCPKVYAISKSKAPKLKREREIGSLAEAVGSLTPKLPLFSVPLMQSTEPSSMLTPPLHSSAFVPFCWEEEPGKPRPYTALATVTDVFATKCLELPPRLLSDTKLPSPTTVLESPYVSKSKFQSSSFRIRRECYGSFSRSHRKPHVKCLPKMWSQVSKEKSHELKQETEDAER